MIARRLGKLWKRIYGTVRNESSDLDFQVEMEEHLKLLAERYRRQGMTSETATRAARRKFGNTTLLQEEGCIAAEWGPSENNRKAKFYAITKSGLKQLAKETEDWERISGVIGRVLRQEGER